MTRPSSYVFIVTYGRSGSTVIQNLLNRLPGVVIRGENENALAHLAQSWAALQHSASASKLREKGEISGPSQPWYGIENVDPEAYGQHLADFFIDHVLQLPPNTRIGGFKEIRWHHAHPMLDHEDEPFLPVYLDFIRRFFPNARFIFNMRWHNGVLKSGWWRKKDQDTARAQLEEADRQFEAYAAAHPDHSLIMRYGQYKNDAEGFRPLFEFLDEPFDADLAQSIVDDQLTHLKWKLAQKNARQDP